MNILVTGADGFIGKNLCLRLSELNEYNLFKVNASTSENELKDFLKETDFIFHLAGSNRPKNKDDFKTVNIEFTNFLISLMNKYNLKIPIIFTSSIQAKLNNEYGISKLKAEDLIRSYGEKTGASYGIFRLRNVFGKWAKPNYNSFIATFCHNIANDIEIKVNDKNSVVDLVYIDDLCDRLIQCLKCEFNSGFIKIEQYYTKTVGEVADLLKNFNFKRKSLEIENVGDGFNRALYSTFLSYFPINKFSYKIPSNKDNRGNFSEIIKTKSAGQVSFFTAHPGITRGGHYHHSKNEKFLVVQSDALFKFRHMITNEVFELEVKSSDLEIVDTIPGWAHDITNVGEETLICVIWANEVFDINKPDTIGTEIFK